jgi:hypothetical protein
MQGALGAVRDILDDHRVVQVPVAECLRVLHVENPAAPRGEHRGEHRGHGHTPELSEAIDGHG